MLKNILNLEGAQQLTKVEQKTINGGKPPHDNSNPNCNQYVIVTATELACLAYGESYRPQYLGANKCSILMPPC